MNTFELTTADVTVMLSHMAAYGLAAILEEESVVEDVRLGWTTGMAPLPWIRATGLDRQRVGIAVRDHASRHTDSTSWAQRTTSAAGSARGLMSPRLSQFGSDDAWHIHQKARQHELDRLVDQQAWSDLTYLAALGEPAYWSYNRQNKPMQDDGAHRMEMQPRNQGSEFVGTRLAKLALSVSERDPGAVVDGLDGSSVTDEIGKDKTDSRTPTGLASPGPTDNAVAWCALWGIGQFPIAPRVNATAHASGHVGRAHAEWFYLPVWRDAWRPARLRTILAAEQTRTAATAGLPKSWEASATELANARGWLNARGVVGLVRFPIARFGSDNAPERRAMRGALLPTLDR